MKRNLLFRLLFIIFFQCTFSQWQQTNGPYGGQFREIVMVENILFQSTVTGGIYKSEDAGVTWSISNSGLPLNGSSAVMTLKTSNSNLYVSITNNGIYKSEDLGESWIPINVGIENYTFLNFFVVGNTIYAPGVSGGVYKSVDTGQTWNFLPDSISDRPFYNFILSGSRLYGFKDKLYESLDFGLSWQEVPISFLGPNGVTAIFEDAGSFYLVANGKLHVSNDNLQSWAEKLAINYGGPNAINIYKYDGNIYVTGSQGNFYSSADNGQTFNSFVNSNIVLDQMFLFVQGANIFLANRGDLWKSSNNGTSWIRSFSGINANSLTAIYENEEMLYAGASNLNLYTTNDQGSSWIKKGNGLQGYGFESIGEIIQVEDNLVLATEIGNIFFSADAGDNWELKFNPNSNGRGNIAYDSGIFATGLSLDNFNISTDNGETWLSKPIDILQPSIAILSVVIKNNLIIVGTSSGKIYKSENIGDSWIDISTPENAGGIYDIELDNNRLFIATSFGAQMSEDFGDTWIPFLNGNFYISDIKIKDHLIYAATSEGFFGTTIGRLEWEPLQNGFPLKNLVKVYVGTNNTYVSTSGFGVWKIANSEIFIPALDDDNDGVPNYQDACVNSLQGVAVDENGCEIIPLNSFLVYSETPTCIGESNGNLQVSTILENHIFNVVVIGDNYSSIYSDIDLFEPLKVENLTTGNYLVTVSIPDISYEQIYGVKINEVSSISGKRQSIDTKNKTVVYSVSGSLEYEVSINNKKQLFNFDSTAQNEIYFTNLKDYNSISITGKNDCQGQFSESFTISDIVFIYPILTFDKVTIDGNFINANVMVYDFSGRLILEKNINQDDNSTIDFGGYKTGVYIVKITSNGSVQNFKIIKQ